MRYRSALIVVEDIKSARKFYEDVLNQKVIMDFGENITFDGDFSLQTKKTWLEFIGKNDITTHANNFELYFDCDNLDQFVKKIKALNIELVHDVKEYIWGQRVIRFYDLDHNIIEVGENMEIVVKRFLNEGLTIEEVAHKTEQPLDYVKHCL